MPRPAHVYATIDVNYFTDDRVLAAGDAWQLHFAAILAAKSRLADGILTRRQLERIAPPTLSDVPGAIERLFDVGLFIHRDDDDTVEINAWSVWNDSAETIEKRFTLSTHRRWHLQPGKAEKGCSHCVEAGLILGSIPGDTDVRSQETPTIDPRITPRHAIDIYIEDHHHHLSEDASSDASSDDPTIDDDDEEEISKNAPPDRVVAVALEILVEREAKAQTERGNPPQTLIWRSRVRGERQNRHASRARLILADNPKMTPHELADMLEPPPVQQVARPKGNEQKIHNLESSIAGLRRADPDDPEIADLERQLAELKAEQ